VYLSSLRSVSPTHTLAAWTAVVDNGRAVWERQYRYPETRKPAE
jgi:hypothetical protein